MQNEFINNFITTLDTTIVNAMQQIDVNAHGILFVVDDDGKLTGCLTDGDIRRWIINTGDLKAETRCVMNPNPRFVFEGDCDKVQKYMEDEKILCMPVLNSDKEIVEVVFYNKSGEKDRNISGSLKEIPVIIMAGGKGTRLYPYTKILPKPLIPIGDIPILERILNRFNQYGTEQFYVTVNYKKEMIKSYFHELKPKYLIHYVEENKPLGTAGSISLIDNEFSNPVIITNCDIIVETDYEKLLKYHIESDNDMTIVSALKNTVIPYGVIKAKENGIVTSMEEKPQLSYFINTGMYIVNPDCIKQIPQDTFFHMTDLADKLIENGARVGMYPVSENSYLDMGQFEEMKKMEERVNGGFLE